MIYKGILPSRGNWASLDISWDSETGEFDGANADIAEQAVDMAQSDGFINIMPCLNYPLTGNALTAEEIGSILNASWNVAGVFPELDLDTDIPEGAIS